MRLPGELVKSTGIQSPAPQTHQQNLLGWGLGTSIFLRAFPGIRTSAVFLLCFPSCSSVISEDREGEDLVNYPPEASAGVLQQALKLVCSISP